MKEPLVFVLPLPANLGNARMHWAAKHKARNSYWEILDNRVLVGMLPKKPAQPLGKAWLSGEFHHTHATDHDNRVARIKHALDWLTSRGYLVDDSDAHLDWGPIRVIKAQHMADRKLVLRLTEVAA